MWDIFLNLFSKFVFSHYLISQFLLLISSHNALSSNSVTHEIANLKRQQVGLQTRKSFLSKLFDKICASDKKV